MPERPSVFNTGQWGVEGAGTPGVVVPATKRLLCTEFGTDPQVPTNPYRPQGFVTNTTAIQGKELTVAPIQNSVICYNDLVYLFSSYLKTTTPTTPTGGTNTRRWSFKPATNAADLFQTYTLEKGQGSLAERLAYAVVNEMTLRFTETEAALTGSMMGQQLVEGITMTASPTDIAALPIDPKAVSVYIGTSSTTNNVQTVTITGTPTGGTFTLTFEGQTTTAIAFNATAGAVQTALEALTTLGKNVTVGGGPAPGTPFTVTFTGLLSAVNATLLTANGALLTGGVPVITVTNTTPGSMTKLLRCLSFELALPSRYVFAKTLNDADPSFSFVVQQGIDPRATIVLEHDSIGSGFMANLRARTTLFCKVVARGPATIETVTGVPFPNAFQLTFPFKFIDNNRADATGVYASTYPMALMYDPAFLGTGGFLQADVDVSLSAL